METYFYSIKNFILDRIQDIQRLIEPIIYKWDPFVISVIAYVIMGLVVIGFGYITYYTYNSEQISRVYNTVVDSTTDYVTRSMINSKVKGFNYDAISQYIKSSGLTFMFGKKFTPLKYIMYKVIMSLLTFVVGMQLNILVGLVGLVVGWFTLDFIANESNKTDNKKMLDDIKCIYDTIGMQSRAGQYVKDTIVDCYLGVRNKRLKQAMLELTSEIIAKNDIQTSVEDFRSKFSNQYIDALAVVIRQSFESGSMSQMMMDIRKQIEDIELAIAEAKKINIRREISTVQFLLYANILGMALYVGIKALTNGLNQ